MKTSKNSGFSLVEILVVVVVLGILAAIVIPQFSNASSEARETYLVNSLQNMRSQIELYKIHHNNLLPGEEGRDESHITVRTNSDRFFAALTNKTNAKGQTGIGAEYIYGPYLQKIPANPFCSHNADRVEIDGTVGNGDYGWHLSTTDSNRGEFQPDDAGYNVFTNQKHMNY